MSLTFSCILLINIIYKYNFLWRIMKIGVKTFDSPEFLKNFEDKADFFEIKKRLKAGNIVGNDAMINWFIPKLPQCGRKSSTSRASGLMRHGSTGIQRYNQPKSWVWHGHPLYRLPFFKNKEPWWLPYNNFTNQALKIILLRFSYF